MEHPQNQRTVDHREPGYVSRIFEMVLSFLVFLFMSWILSIVVEWLGMIFIWKDDGISHGREMYVIELTYLDSVLMSHLDGRDQYKRLNQVKTDYAKWLFKKLYISENEWQEMKAKHYGRAEIFMRPLVNAVPYYIAAFYVTQLFMVRLTVLLLSWPLFFIAAVVGATDGLKERMLRRWGAGRESGDQFRLAKSLIVPSFCGAWMIYLSMPVTANPTYIIVPFAFLTGFAIRQFCAKLKKYY